MKNRLFKENTVIYLVRHCEPDAQTGDDLARPLTEKGREQAGEAALFLKGKGISAVWSSDALRALETAQVFADMAGLPIREDAKLREGVLGCRPEDNPVYSPMQWKDPDFRLPGGESLNDVKQRMRSAVAEILALHGGEHVMVCTHGTAMSALISSFDPSFGWEEARDRKRVWPWIMQMDFGPDGRFETCCEIWPE